MVSFLTFSKHINVVIVIPTDYNNSNSNISNNVSSKHLNVQPAVVNVPHPINYNGATYSGIFFNPNHFKTLFKINIYPSYTQTYCRNVYQYVQISKFTINFTFKYS
eukprot:166387_1